MTARAAFSRVVAAEPWVAEASAWIDDRLVDAGLVATGPVEQTRIRPWSTQLVVPTDAGRCWFKANASAMRFEPALHELLARLLPEDVDAPLAIDSERGWVLTRDRGLTLGETREPTESDWCAVVERTAVLQQQLTPHREAVLATGLPDASPDRVLGRFDRLVEIFADLPPDHPAHVDLALRDALDGARPRLVAAVATLEAGPLPVTWQHGDLHPWNVFDTGADGLRVFDFGDSQWAHALEVLSVPRGWIADRDDVRWAPVEQAYGAVWDLRPADLAELTAASEVTHPVNRALTWWWCLQDATADEWARWGEAPLYHLTGVLDRA